MLKTSFSHLSTIIEHIENFRLTTKAPLGDHHGQQQQQEAQMKELEVEKSSLLAWLFEMSSPNETRSLLVKIQKLIASL